MMTSFQRGMVKGVVLGHIIGSPAIFCVGLVAHSPLLAFIGATGAMLAGYCWDMRIWESHE